MWSLCFDKVRLACAPFCADLFAVATLFSGIIAVTPDACGGTGSNW
jgi:hypothetical protein